MCSGLLNLLSFAGQENNKNHFLPITSGFPVTIYQVYGQISAGAKCTVAGQPTQTPLLLRRPQWSTELDAEQHGGTQTAGAESFVRPTVCARATRTTANNTETYIANGASSVCVQPNHRRPHTITASGLEVPYQQATVTARLSAKHARHALNVTMVLRYQLNTQQRPTRCRRSPNKNRDRIVLHVIKHNRTNSLHPSKELCIVDDPRYHRIHSEKCITIRMILFLFYSIQWDITILRFF